MSATQRVWIRTVRAVLMVAGGAAGAVLCVRAVLGPFSFGPLQVHSPLTAEGIFSVSVMLLLLLQKGGDEEAERPRESAGKRPLIPAALVLGLVALAFGWNLQDPFLGDDYIAVNRAPVTAYAVAASFRTPGGDGFFRPAGSLYNDAAFLWAGWNPFRWHVCGLALHLINCGALYILVWTLWRSSSIAFAATALFGLHGTRPEVVTWISGSNNALACAFALVSVVVVFRGRSDRVSIARLAVVSLTTALAVLCKETAYATPVLLLGFAAASRRLSERPVQAALASVTFVTAALLAYRWALFHGPGGYVDSATGRPMILSLKLLPTAKALLARLWSILFFPVDWRAPMDALLPAAILLACGLFLYLAFTSQPSRVPIRWLMLTAAACALPAIHLALIPESGLGSRVLYLPSVAFCVALAHGLASVRETRIRHAVVFGMIFCFGLGLAHNLVEYHRMALTVDAACAEAAGRSPGIPVVAPKELQPMGFLGGDFPECVAMKRAQSGAGEAIPE